MFTTNPNSLPIVLLMVPGVLLFFSLFLSFRLLLGRFFPKQPASKRSLYAIYLSGLPSFLLLLSSVNQLTWRDFTLVLFLVICLWFYTGRINLAKS
ncbi:MAG: hypothetical protein ABI221_00500 [Candidatus Saccharimonadales bacterium]